MRKQPGDAVEGGLDDLGGGGVEGEEEGVEDELGVGQDEAEERGRGQGIGGGVGQGLELVEGGLGGGDEVGVLAPGDVLDDLVEGGAEDAAALGGAA